MGEGGVEDLLRLPPPVGRVQQNEKNPFPPRSARATRHLPADLVKPVFTPSAPRYRPISSFLFSMEYFFPPSAVETPPPINARDLREHGVPHRRFRETREVPRRGIQPGGVVSAGVRETGPGKTHLPGPGVHEENEFLLAPGNVVRESVAGVVGGAKERGGEEVDHQHPVAGLKAQPGPRLAARLRGNGGHLPGVGPLQNEEARHHLRETPRGKRRIRVPGPHLPAVDLHEIRRGDVSERIAGRLYPRGRSADTEAKGQKQRRSDRVRHAVVSTRRDSGFP